MSVRRIDARRALRGIALPVTIVGFSVMAAAHAHAHVGVSPGTGAAGEYTVATVSVPHGCDGSPTTSVTIKVPEQVLAVTPTRNALWDVEKTIVKLETPVEDAHGNEVTEKVDTVVYTARTPLPEGYRDAFELSFKVPDVAGETLVFPTVQKCVKGQTDWVEVAEEGGAEPEHPAPVLQVVEGSGGGHGQVSSASEGDDSSDGIAYGALAAGVLALLAAGAALVTSRKA
jgi:uncharacterized protein YcnI